MGPLASALSVSTQASSGPGSVLEAEIKNEENTTPAIKGLTLWLGRQTQEQVFPKNVVCDLLKVSRDQLA